VYRSWRRIADSYPQPRALIGEVWLPDAPDRFAQYLRSDELHTAFNFDFLGCPWDATAVRKTVDGGIALHAPVDAPPTWVLSNHDVIRHVTRYGRADTRFSLDYRQFGAACDLALGTRRARAADAPPGVLAFTRGHGFTCVVNLSPHQAPMPPHVDIILASQPLSDSGLPSDCAAWLRTA
jgi:hypothetical protein